MDVLMPQLGETVAEGRIAKWFKAAGDDVQPGDLLFEIETDKTAMEVPATSAGTLLEIRVAAGAVVPVGAVVAVIEATGGQHTAPPARNVSAPAGVAPTLLSPLNSKSESVQGAAHAQTQALSPRFGDGARSAKSFAYPDMDLFHEVRTPERNFGPARLAVGVAVTPLARRLAGEKGIDLARVTGSGPHGRIVARDVEKAMTQHAAPPAGPSAAEIVALYYDVPFAEVPLDPMRRTIAARLTQAKQSVPHFYLTADVTVDELLRIREQANAAAPIKDGKPAYRLSVNDFMVKALALALQRVPAANAVWAQDRILRFTHSDISVAVALEEGLLTPVLRHAESKSIGAISGEMRDLAARARERRLAPDEYRGGVSTVSNLGMFGVREFSAIVNPPQSSILAVGETRRAPFEAEAGGLRFATLMTVTLSCDHRVIDGAVGARVLAAFRQLIEQPVTMLV